MKRNRAEHVQKIKREVRQGTYVIDPRAVAEHVLSIREDLFLRGERPLNTFRQLKAK